MNRRKKFVLGKIAVLFITLIFIITLLASLDKEPDLVHTDFNSIDEYLAIKYKDMNYNYVEIDNYYFIAISKRSLFQKGYFNEIIYFNNPNQYEVILDGSNYNIDDYKDYVTFNVNTQGKYTHYAYCFISHHNDNYLLHIKETSLYDIYNVSDIYSEFLKLESIDYGVDYYYKVINSSDFTDMYTIEAEFAEIGKVVIDNKSIAEVFVQAKERNEK